MATQKQLLQEEIKTFWATVPQMSRAKATRIIKKALDIIQANQTQDEQLAEETKHLNRRGWCPCDAKWAAELIRQIREVDFLCNHQIAEASEMFSHYSRQLAEHKMAENAAKQTQLSIAA